MRRCARWSAASAASRISPGGSGRKAAGCRRNGINRQAPEKAHGSLSGMAVARSADRGTVEIPCQGSSRANSRPMKIVNRIAITPENASCRRGRFEITAATESARKMP